MGGRAEYTFEPEEVEAAQRYVDAHGFAVIRRAISDELAERLRRDIVAVLDPEGDAEQGSTRMSSNFIEHSPACESLLHEPLLMSIHKALIGSDAERGMTLHRTSARIKMPGAAVHPWHEDYTGGTSLPPKSSAEVLNRGDGPNGMYFYLNGSRPENAGLTVLEYSHLPTFEPPTGFAWNSDAGKRGLREDGAPADSRTSRLDVPGAVAVISDPTDLVIFAARTLHAVFPAPLDMPEPRLLVGLRFRASPELPHGVTSPWPRSELAAELVARQPPSTAPLLRGYTGVKMDWKPEDSEEELGRWARDREYGRL